MEQTSNSKAGPPQKVIKKDQSKRVTVLKKLDVEAAVFLCQWKYCWLSSASRRLQEELKLGLESTISL